MFWDGSSSEGLLARGNHMHPKTVPQRSFLENFVKSC